MNIPSLTSAQLKEALALFAKKETLQAQLARIDQEIEGIFGGNGASGASAKRGRSAKAKASGKAWAAGSSKTQSKPRRRQGSLKEKVLARIKDAGEAGISLKDLSNSLKVKPQNLYAWFNGTGKKVEGLKKIGRGLYSLGA